ncbi:amidase family protein [Maribacter litopenaei]|uniref:amidase family protein n=1 Tax=Maribacter litopenaei TaxID=2976127 RepID=UPI0030846731
MKKLIIPLLVGLLLSCKNESAPKKDVVLWEPYNDSLEIAANADYEISRMRYKLIQSKVLDKNEVFLPLYDEVSKMDEAQYESLKPLILEQDIYTISNHIEEGRLSYEALVLFYLYRIYKYELNNETTLNTVIALNKEVVAEARDLDEQRKKGNLPEVRHPIFGMPILLKDNINTSGMKTTAGSIALMENEVDDSFIVHRLKENGALILGKVNLSEWAYFLCSGCPVGYSAVGGQTLNPYGRRIFETGGSSSGSGTSVAANYAVAAVGTETSGSILSPSSQNSVVGLKPTIGLLSRSGIVPISSTLDTPDPMTKNVNDNAILLSAMLGYDAEDSKSVKEEFSRDSIIRS